MGDVQCASVTILDDSVLDGERNFLVILVPSDGDGSGSDDGVKINANASSTDIHIDIDIDDCKSFTGKCSFL